MGGTPGLPTAGQPGPMQPGEFVSASKRGEVTFHLRDVPPPSPLYVRPEEQLTFTTVCSAASVTFRAAGRLLLTDGSLQAFALDFKPSSTRIQETFAFALPEGYLLNVSMGILTGSPRRGQLFMDVTIFRGSGTGGITIARLMSDYLTNVAGLAWPGGRVTQSVEGPGFLRSVQVTTPAAGAEWTQAVPVGARWRVMAVDSQLQTSAAVANRQPGNSMDDGVNTYWVGTPNQSVPASQTVRVSHSGSAVSSSANVVDVVSLLPPNTVQSANHRINSRTPGLQAADAYTLINMLVEEWIEL